jgi:dihydroflavonol-4-reductase
VSLLVTGATGFVGSAVARRLLAEGQAVRVLARPGGDRRNLAGLDLEIAEGDLSEPASLSAALRGVRGLFHVAADYRLWCRDPEAMRRVNVEGTRELLRRAADAGVERIVYTSSVAVLGLNHDGRPADEDTPATLADMIGAYKRSKFLAEAEVRRLIDDEGVPVVIVNPSAPIGPRDIKPTPTGRMVCMAASGKMRAYVETGLNVVHVDDVATGHWLAFDRGQIGRRYILGGENLSLREILAAIARLVGGPGPRWRLPHGVITPIAHVAEAWARITGGGEPIVTVDGVRMSRHRMYFTAARAAGELGFSARPAERALADAVGWFREHAYLSR